jgi:hypothetical protein
VREAATSLTCELFCLNSRNNSARAPVNYDLKKHRASALVAIRRVHDLLGKKFRRNQQIRAARRERGLIQFY